jgi:hypothetical protein
MSEESAPIRNRPYCGQPVEEREHYFTLVVFAVFAANSSGVAEFIT